MPIKDRTGIKYGKLTAIEYCGKSKWKCKCDCGKEIIVYGGHLENGHTKSCGCIRPPRTNLQNQKFGKLKVIEWRGQGKWLCQCDCGNQVEVITYNLKNGNTKSCGCYQKEQTSNACFKSLVGHRFGKLIVIERVKNNKFNHVCYKCQCDCGGIIIVDATNLRNGNTNSCGCIKSKGEMIINNLLQKYQITFQPQYSHNSIVLDSERHPFFDFAILKDGAPIAFIEYNGKQHYQYSGYGWDNEENYHKTVARDNQKRLLCSQYNIPLFEIPYWEIDNLEKIVYNIIKELKLCNMEEAQDEVSPEADENI